MRVHPALCLATSSMCGGLSTAPGAAEPSPRVLHRLNAALAPSGMNAAIADCERKGFKVSAAVVDVDGGLQSSMRGDGAGIQTLRSATDEALPSEVQGVDSSVWVDRAARGESISPLLNPLPPLLLAKAAW